MMLFEHDFSLLQLLDPAKQLLRKRLIDRVRTIFPCPHLFVHGQAGQGKSTFVAQLLHATGAVHCWHQVSEADNDPMYLLSRLYRALRAVLPGFSSPMFEKPLDQLGFAPGREFDLVRPFLDDLERSLSGHFSLVLDDLHLLEDGSASAKLVDSICNQAPQYLRCILVSRRPMLFHSKNGSKTPGLVIGNDELALKRQEIAELYSTVLKVPVTTQVVNDLYNATEGWIMGLRMIAHALTGDAFRFLPEGAAALPFDPSSRDVMDYFRSEVFERLPRELQTTLAKLSLLSDVPLELAEQLAEVPDIDRILESMTESNLFVRPLDNARTSFAFHHLFRDFLQERSLSLLSPEVRTETLEAAAEYALDRGRGEEALEYLLQAENFSKAQELLAGVGGELLAVNRIRGLKQSLDRIPQPLVEGHPWLSYYYGVILFDLEPPKARKYLENALALFRKAGNEPGELAASTYILYYMITVSSSLRKGVDILARAERLYNKLSDTLNPSAAMQLCNVFALAHLYFRYDVRACEDYIAVTSDLARAHHSPNFLAAASIARQIRHGYCGDWRSYAVEIENSQPFLHSPEVNPMFKGFLQVCRVNLLELSGDVDNYHHQKGLFLRLVEKRLSQNTLAGPLITQWEAVIDLACGRIDQTVAILERALQTLPVQNNPHMHSQYLMILAYALALQGKSDRALDLADKAAALREEAGGPLYQILCRLYVGAVHVCLGNADPALDNLNRLFEGPDAHKSPDHRAAALAQRAALRIAAGEIESALTDLQDMFSIMRHNGYTFFFTWTPEVMEPLLSLAVKHGIEPLQARELAALRLDRALLDDGTVIPLLNVYTLGRLEMVIDGQTVVHAADITPIQRQFLAQVLTAADLRVGRDEMQAALWPDSRPDKARAAFDTTLSRLRKLLNAKFGLPSRFYFSLRRGVLSLQNVQIDAHRFIAMQEKGLQHAGRNEPWQAGNAFRQAHTMWNGEYLPGIGGEGGHNTFRDDLTRRYCDMVLAWAPILHTEEGPSEAVRILERALALEPLNHYLNQALYELHIRTGMQARADQILSRYRNRLYSDGFTSAQTETAILSILSQTS